MLQNHVIRNATVFWSHDYSKINKIGKDKSNPIPKARNKNIYIKAKMLPSVDIKFKYKSAEEPDINIDGNRVVIMFFEILLVCQKIWRFTAGKIDHIFFQNFALKKMALVIPILRDCWSIIEKQNCCNKTT